MIFTSTWMTFHETLPISLPHPSPPPPYSTPPHQYIGVGRFRLLGGHWLEYWGARGANSQQPHDVVLMSMRRNHVSSTSCRRHVPTRFFINLCQIITFLILKSDNVDNIENSRIELKGIVLPVPSIKLKLHLLLFYPSTWFICDFFLFHIEIEGNVGELLGAKGYVAPPSDYWGSLALLPPALSPLPPTPSSYVYAIHIYIHRAKHEFVLFRFPLKHSNAECIRAIYKEGRLHWAKRAKI